MYLDDEPITERYDACPETLRSPESWEEQARKVLTAIEARLRDYSEKRA